LVLLETRVPKELLVAQEQLVPLERKEQQGVRVWLVLPEHRELLEIQALWVLLETRAHKARRAV
jgi:hypothetical protein